MNYASDALWWCLSDPNVRTLAALLTAPALWMSDAELPVPVLLGEAGLRLLLAWDQAPQPLQSYMDAQPPHGRLGTLAENLLGYWFAHAPHAELLARNLPIATDGRLQGALDFVVRLNGRVYAVELTCKYFGGGALLAQWHGLNRADTLSAKIAKLKQQSNLAHTPAGRAALAGLGAADTLTTATIVRGMGFTRQAALPAPLNPLAWTGTLNPDSSQWDTWRASGCRLAALPRLSWLAPARLSADATFRLPEHTEQLSNGLYALLEERDAQVWHETRRLMIRHEAD